MSILDLSPCSSSTMVNHPSAADATERARLTLLDYSRESPVCSFASSSSSLSLISVCVLVGRSASDSDSALQAMTMIRK